MEFESDNTEELTISNFEILPRQPELPTVPEAFRRSEYEGWLAETFQTLATENLPENPSRALAGVETVQRVAERMHCPRPQ